MNRGKYVYTGLWITYAAVVIHINTEGMEIGEWVILFSENFEGMAMGMGMGNSKKITIFLGVQVSPK